MRRIVLLLLVLSSLTAQFALAQMQAPDALARSVTDEVLKAIRADKDLQAGNPKKIIELIEAKVAPHFEFTSMTRLAMGRNWSQASAEQRKALTDEFRTLLVRTYTTAFTQYKDQQIDYRPLKVAPDETDVVVKSVIRQPGASEPVTVDYRMEKTERAWKVYDVKIAGVSMVETYRGTFNSEVQRGGVDGLLKTLRDRNRAYLAKMETGAK
jgi:phospholipid transport system substrate-binding protein